MNDEAYIVIQEQTVGFGITKWIEWCKNTGKLKEYSTKNDKLIKSTLKISTPAS